MKKIFALVLLTASAAFAQIASPVFPSGAGATTQISNAINAAIAAGGGDVFLPAGTYALTSAIPITWSCPPGLAQLRIHGAGPATVLQTAGTAAFIITGGAACNEANLIMENMTIRSTATAPYGLQINSIAGFVFRNINLEGPSTIGVQFVAAQQGEWDGGTFRDALTDFDFEASSGVPFVASNTVEVHGVNIYAADNGTAFYINKIDDLDIHSNNIVGDIGVPAAGCIGFNQVASGFGYVTFHHNHVESCRMGAHMVQAIVSDNSFYPPIAGGLSGIADIEVAGSGNIVHGNLLQAAITIDTGSLGTKFESNTLANTQPYFSFTDHGAFTQIFGNTCYANGFCGLGTIFQDALTVYSYKSSGGDVATFFANSVNAPQGITMTGAGVGQPIYARFGVSSAIWGSTGGPTLNIGSSDFLTTWATVTSTGISTPGNILTSGNLTTHGTVTIDHTGVFGPTLNFTNGSIQSNLEAIGTGSGITDWDTRLTMESGAGGTSAGLLFDSFGLGTDIRFQVNRTPIGLINSSGISMPGATLGSSGQLTVDTSGNLSTSGNASAALYSGPATAPSGSCSTIGWVFSQDGHATFCNGSVWITKI